MLCGFHYYINRFLKRTSHKRSDLLAIDTVPCNGHEMSSTRHYVTQQGQVTVVYVRTVKRDNMVHFTFNSLSHSLDSKHRKYFTDVIGCRTHGIHVFFTEHPHKRNTVSFQDPFSDMFKLSFLCDGDSFLVVLVRQVHVHFRDGFDPLQGHISQHVGFNAA